jgi:hypothetical protein
LSPRVGLGWVGGGGATTEGGLSPRVGLGGSHVFRMVSSKLQVQQNVCRSGLHVGGLCLIMRGVHGGNSDPLLLRNRELGHVHDGGCPRMINLQGRLDFLNVRRLVAAWVALHTASTHGTLAEH